MASEDLRDMDSQSADLYTQQQRLASQMAEARVSYVSSLWAPQSDLVFFFSSASPLRLLPLSLFISSYAY